MPTSDAERQRRSRAHRAGDHSLCLASRCVTLRGCGPVERAVRELAEALKFEASDPRSVLLAVASQLAAAFDARPSALLASEIRATVGAITDSPADPPGVLDELRARRAGRRVEALLESAK